MGKNQVFGGKCIELLGNYNLELSSWKTLQTSFEWEDLMLLEVLPKSGMSANGQLFRLQISEPAIKERDGFVLPTPVARLPAMEPKISNGCQGLPALWNNKRESDWGGVGSQSAICRVDDGLPTGMDRSKHNKIRQERLRALGNAIVPQCSEWIGLQVLKSGLLDNLID